MTESQKMMDLIEDYVNPTGDAVLKHQALKQLQAIADSLDWISVTVRYPDKGQKVLYYFEPIGIATGQYDKEYNQFYGKLGFLTDDVTHWKPLPEPPKDK